MKLQIKHRQQELQRLDPRTAQKMAEARDALWGDKSLVERFGSLSGRELQEKIFATYEVNGQLIQVDWFQKDGSRNIVRHHLNNRKQTSIKLRYKERSYRSMTVVSAKESIMKYGIMMGCRSEAWLVQHLGCAVRTDPVHGSKAQTGTVRSQGLLARTSPILPSLSERCAAPSINFIFRYIYI